MADLPEHVQRNREVWDAYAERYVEPGRAQLGQRRAVVGRLRRARVASWACCRGGSTGWTSIELGCGTAYVSAWLARRGARPVGIDNSPAQLETARRFQQEFGLEFPLHLGNAEQTPFPDASFDLAISEYGASIWCDPYRWIPEAARLLRPGGELIFLVNGTICMLCVPDEEDAAADRPAAARLLRHAPVRVARRRLGRVPPRLRRLIRLLRANGFEVEDLIEVRPPADAAPATRARPSSGRGAGRSRRSGRRASAERSAARIVFVENYEPGHELRRGGRAELRRSCRAATRRRRWRSSQQLAGGGPALELAIGTGRIALPLAARGCPGRRHRPLAGDGRAAAREARRRPTSP